jgi:RNA polymerase sigma-70 factor (ECF subfamily)
MLESVPSPFHDLPSGLCEDGSGEAAGLIQRTARGDGQALLQLHSLWAPTLLGIACRMLGDRRAAADLLRGLFTTIWKNASQYDPHQVPPFVWAFALLRDAAIDKLRRDPRLKREAAGPQSERHEPGKVLGANDCRRLRAALDQLDPEGRIGLEQAVMLEYAGRASGETPPQPSVTAKIRLRQALETVRIQLSRHEL